MQSSVVDKTIFHEKSNLKYLFNILIIRVVKNSCHPEETKVLVYQVLYWYCDPGIGIGIGIVKKWYRGSPSYV